MATEEKPKKRRSGPSGPSGEHRTPRVILTLDPDEREAQVEHAAKRGMSWAEWARAALHEARIRQAARPQKSSG